MRASPTEDYSDGGKIGQETLSGRSHERVVERVDSPSAPRYPFRGARMRIVTRRQAEATTVASASVCMLLAPAGRDGPIDQTLFDLFQFRLKLGRHISIESIERRKPHTIIGQGPNVHASLERALHR